MALRRNERRNDDWAGRGFLRVLLGPGSPRTDCRSSLFRELYLRLEVAARISKTRGISGRPKARLAWRVGGCASSDRNGPAADADLCSRHVRVFNDVRSPVVVSG